MHAERSVWIATANLKELMVEDERWGRRKQYRSVLEVLADDVGVKLDLPAWCRAHRQRLLEVREEGRLIRVLIMKTGERA